MQVDQMIKYRLDDPGMLIYHPRRKISDLRTFLKQYICIELIFIIRLIR